jgi:adenylate cyclase
MPPTHTFLFADLAGFTTFTEREGDEAAADAAMLFAQRARELAAEHGAHVVKCLGDAVMMRTGGGAAAVRLGLELHADLAGSGLPPVHSGAHTGRAVERGGDWFGATVNLAARVCHAARSGELLLTDSTVGAAGRLAGVELEGLGPQFFKNVSGPVSVYSARASATRTATAPVRLVPAFVSA